MTAQIELPDPQELNDEEVSVRLWQLIHRLAGLNIFLHCTDHLSDRQLYSRLRADTFGEGTASPRREDRIKHIDMLGSGSDEDIHLYLKYYATEKEKRHYVEHFPRLVVPEHCEPPYRRDHRLPRKW